MQPLGSVRFAKSHGQLINSLKWYVFYTQLKNMCFIERFFVSQTQTGPLTTLHVEVAANPQSTSTKMMSLEQITLTSPSPSTTKYCRREQLKMMGIHVTKSKMTRWCTKTLITVFLQSSLLWTSLKKQQFLVDRWMAPTFYTAFTFIGEARTTRDRSTHWMGRGRI